MNDWVRKSIDLVLNSDYLDKLQRIYDIEEPIVREISPAIEQEIRRSYENRDKLELIKSLFKLKKFPFNDPYIPSLRKYKASISLNPKTIERIGNRLLNMAWDELMIRSAEPKDPNRQMGSKFRNWIRNLDYPLQRIDEFKRSDEFVQVDGSLSKIAILDATETEMKTYANVELDCGLDKKPDFIVKVDGEHVIGEAKYIGDFGGNQKNKFRETMNFILQIRGDATRVGVLDGVVWLDTQVAMCKEIRRVQSDCLSALLLSDYFESLID